MLFPQVDSAHWAAIYELEPITSACLKCGNLQTLCIPFAHREIRGLLSDHTECGDEFQQSIFITLNAADKQAALDLFTQPSFCASSSL